jgi:PAS domain S-box-containing protein
MDRHRTAIDMGVSRRLGRAEPAPAVRSEVVRRFRTFCRLASLDWAAAQPSFDGLGGNSSAALENVIQTAVSVASDLDGSPALLGALTELGEKFRAAIRRSFQPREETHKRRRNGRKKPNAGRRVRAAIDRISDAYIALCLDTGTIYDLNPAAEALFGAETDELLGRELKDFVGPEDTDGFQNLEARLDAGEDAAPMRMLFKRLGGERVPVELSAANHTIGGRRLAILSARECTEVVLQSAGYSTRTTSPAANRAISDSTARST